MNHEKRISRATTIILFLALIRTIAEPFRLQHASGISLTFEIIQPYLLAALITAFGLFAITILQYFERYRWIIAIGVLVIAAMVMIKVKYL
jgi:hypothetical protein